MSSADRSQYAEAVASLSEGEVLLPNIGYFSLKSNETNDRPHIYKPIKYMCSKDIA